MLRITKKGELLYLKGQRWYKVSKEDALSSLNQNFFGTCDLDEGVTLRSIFSLIRKYNLEPIVGWDMAPFYKEIRKKSQDLDWDPGDYLEVYWCPIIERDYDDETKTTISKYPQFHAIRPKQDFTKWGISFSPTYDLAHLPIKINKEFFIYIEHDRKPALKTYMEFSLNEIISAIMWELTWHGGPESRNKRSAELKESYTEAMDIAEGKTEGKLVTYSSEEVFNELGMDTSFEDHKKWCEDTSWRDILY